MNNILKCDLCDGGAGDDPYHATIDGNGHVHICANCFDPQQHDLGVLKQQHHELLTVLIGLLSEAEAIAQIIPAYGESPNIKNAKAISNKVEKKV